MAETDERIQSLIQYMLEPLETQKPEQLFEIVTRLKRNDGESWAVGEMLHRILTHFYIPLQLSD